MGETVDKRALKSTRYCWGTEITERGALRETYLFRELFLQVNNTTLYLIKQLS